MSRPANYGNKSHWIHLPLWVRWWFTLSTPLVLYDIGFCLSRPHSFKGGYLFKVFAPYEHYGTVDLIYGEQRWREGDRFCEAQAVLNVVEVVFQLLALRLWRRQQRSAAVLTAFCVSLMTFWKTALYWLYDLVAGGRHTGHNDLAGLALYYGTNGFWIVVPLLVVIELGSSILAVMQAAGASGSQVAAAKPAPTAAAAGEVSGKQKST